MSYSDDECIVEPDQGEKRGGIREDELNTRNLLRDQDTDCCK
jgi:hypothetical protein